MATTERRFRTLTRTRWSDLCLFGSATCLAIAIVTVHASLATGAQPGDVLGAATRVAGNPISWIAVAEAAAVTVVAWQVMRGRITISLRRNDANRLRGAWW